MCECKTNKSSNSKSILNHAVLYRVPKISLKREEQAEGLPLKCSASRLLDPFISSSSSSSVCTRDMFNDENNCVDWSLWKILIRYLHLLLLSLVEWQTKDGV